MKWFGSDINLASFKNFLSGYSILLFWLIWGISMSLFFGIITGEYQIGLSLMGFGIFLGTVLQFVKIIWIKRAAWMLVVVLALIIFWKPLVSFLQISLDKKISRSFLVDDVRQMAAILEKTHPDPYYHGGGKIAFHRRMQNTIETIPQEGLTKIEFYRHLCPFVAAVGDGHTSFWLPFGLDYNSPGGIPLLFHIVEDIFYVSGVVDSLHRNLIGSILISVEDVPVAELLDRQSRIKGYDNKYQLMRYLGYNGSLWHKELLKQLIPEWDGDSIRVVLQSPDGAMKNLVLSPNTVSQDQLIIPPTSVDLPSIEKSNYVYRFMDDNSKNALLLIENMYTYRESFEMEMVLQGSLRKNLARYLYRKYNDESPPANREDLVAGIPSITELCRELVQQMKHHQTENLIIDLRRNEGGNAFLSTIFFYFLHGKEELISFSDKRSIFVKKYSPLFWKQYSGWNISEINKHQPIKLLNNDYDFSGYPKKGDKLTREESIRIIEDEAFVANTFWEEYQSEKYSGFYCPKNIIILCSPVTTSSGYAFMYDHWAAGARVLGVPSSQAGNNFGAWVGFKLKHSRLGGGVSHLYITHFRDDPDMGRIFCPDFEMTYDILQKYNFDPHSEVIYANEIIDSRKL